MEAFKERIARLRKERQLKPAEIARRMGVTEAAYRHYESGETKQPNLKTGLLLARALTVSPWYLAYGQESADVPDPKQPSEELVSRVDRLEAVLREFLPAAADQNEAAEAVAGRLPVDELVAEIKRRSSAKSKRTT